MFTNADADVFANADADVYANANANANAHAHAEHAEAANFAGRRFFFATYVI